MSGHGLDLQLEVYGKGEAPQFPFSYEEREERAREALAGGPFGYIASGAKDTMRAKSRAEQRRRRKNEPPRVRISSMPRLAKRSGAC